MKSTRRHQMLALRCGLFAVLATLAAIAPVCAETSIPVTRLDELAGQWRGWNAEANPVDFVIQTDGSFEARITIMRTNQLVIRRGKIRLENSEVLYDADLSYGKITLHSDGQKRKFILHGTYKTNMGTLAGQNFETEYSETR
jgi:hypothetical protein